MKKRKLLKEGKRERKKINLILPRNLIQRI